MTSTGQAKPAPSIRHAVWLQHGLRMIFFASGPSQLSGALLNQQVLAWVHTLVFPESVGLEVWAGSMGPQLVFGIGKIHVCIYIERERESERVGVHSRGPWFGGPGLLVGTVISSLTLTIITTMVTPYL